MGNKIFGIIGDLDNDVAVLMQPSHENYSPSKYLFLTGSIFKVNGDYYISIRQNLNIVSNCPDEKIDKAIVQANDIVRALFGDNDIFEPGKPWEPQIKGFKVTTPLPYDFTDIETDKLELEEYDPELLVDEV